MAEFMHDSDCNRCAPVCVASVCVAFAVGRGWWWVLVLALALVHVAWLRAPICRWWWVLRPVRVASLGARVRHWWGMVVGARPCLCPSLCAHPCLCGRLPLLRVVVVVSVGGALLDVYGTRGLTFG